MGFIKYVKDRRNAATNYLSQRYGGNFSELVLDATVLGGIVAFSGIKTYYFIHSIVGR